MNTIAKSLLGLFHVQKPYIFFRLRRADLACNKVFMPDIIINFKQIGKWQLNLMKYQNKETPKLEHFENCL